MNHITRAGLVARLTLPTALSTLVEAAAWLAAHGCEPVIEHDSARAAGVESRWRTVGRESLPAAADVIIAFGGDGTLLDVAGTIAHAAADVPVIGVNLGHLGFLTEVNRGELTGALGALLSGSARMETRLMIQGRIERDGQLVGQHLALNDIVVTRGALSRMIEIDVTVDDHDVCHVKADGLILATATGSTAYNLSAGGPIVDPHVDAFVLTPIAPHTLTNRPLVLPATVRIALRPVIEPQATDIIATFDGQHGVPLSTGDVVVVSRAPRLLRLLRVSNRTHFDMLREKLQWGK